VLVEEKGKGPMLAIGVKEEVPEEELDPWMLYIYAIKSPATKKKKNRRTCLIGNRKRRRPQ
jgi:hypothetical protein